MQWCRSPSVPDSRTFRQQCKISCLIRPLQRVTVFISDCVERERVGYLVRQALRRSLYFAMHCRFPSETREVQVFLIHVQQFFSREAIDDLTQPVKVNPLEGALLEAFSDKPKLHNSAYKRGHVSVSVGT